MSDVEREALAEARGPDGFPLGPWVADLVLASDWLAQVKATARAEALEEAIRTAERQTDLTELMVFERPSDFRKGVLTTIAALRSLKDGAQ